MRTRVLMFVALLAMLMSAAHSADALLIYCKPTTNYTINGTFAAADGGGTFSGTLTAWEFQLPQGIPPCYNPYIGGGFDISVSGGTFTSFDYSSYTNSAYWNSNYSLASAPNELVLTFTDLNNGARYLQLAFDPTPLVSGGTFTFDPANSFEQDGKRTVASLHVTAVPEPSSLMLLGGGAFGLAGVIRRRWLR